MTDLPTASYVGEPDPAAKPGVWVDQSRRMQGDRFICGDCGREWPKVVVGPPFDWDRCGSLDGSGCGGGLLTAVWNVYPGGGGDV